MIKKLLSGKSKLSRNFYGILLCAICIIACTLAWFFNFKQSETQDLNFGSIDAADFEISLDGVKYSDSLNIDLPSSLEFEPVSGDGETMYQPLLEAESRSADEEGTTWTEIEYDESGGKNSFYKFTLYFRCDKEGSAVLSELNVDPVAAAANRQWSANSSTYIDKNGKEITSAGKTYIERPVTSSVMYELITGNPVITKDYIAGSARIMMMNEETVGDGFLQKTIFIPNNTYHLNITESNGECSCSFNEKWSGTETYAYYNGTEKTDYSKLDTMTETELNKAEGCYAMEFSGEKAEDGYYYGQLEVCIWLEGYDNEAHDIMAGGQIQFYMKFDYEETDE